MQVHTQRKKGQCKEIPACRNIPSKAVYQTHLPARVPYLSFLAQASALKGEGMGREIR